VSTGPYRIETYQRNNRLVLVRNTHWDPKTDPLRPAYPDRFVLIFDQTPTAATQRILASKDGDQTAISLEQVPPELLSAVAADTAARRATIGTTPYVGYLKINTQRVRELTVRRALNCAFDRDGYVQAAGGRASAEPATTLLPRTVAGYRHYNAYDCGPSGDPEKAKQMLGGRTVPLRYGFRNSGRGPGIAAFVRDSLGKAGFDVGLVPLDSSQYYSTIGTKDNGLDIYLAAWGADWPTGATVIPALVDGRTITARGNTNTSYFHDDAINAEIDRIGAITHLDQAARAWSALDEKIMREHAPLVPVYYDRTCTLNGSRVGGLYLHDVLGLASLVNAFVE
jgi:peptide/nickel transport system substrate-binding protein